MLNRVWELDWVMLTVLLDEGLNFKDENIGG